MNGLVSLIDASFNLYRFEWQFSACELAFQSFESAIFTGLGYTSPRGAPSGSFIVVLTGEVEGHLHAVSVLYERT